MERNFLMTLAIIGAVALVLAIVAGKLIVGKKPQQRSAQFPEPTQMGRDLALMEARERDKRNEKPLTPEQTLQQWERQNRSPRDQPPRP